LGLLEAVNGIKMDKTMPKRQTVVHITLHKKKLKNEQCQLWKGDEYRYFRRV